MNEYIDKQSKVGRETGDATEVGADSAGGGRRVGWPVFIGLFILYLLIYSYTIYCFIFTLFIYLNE